MSNFPSIPYMLTSVKIEQADCDLDELSDNDDDPILNMCKQLHDTSDVRKIQIKEEFPQGNKIPRQFLNTSGTHRNGTASQFHSNPISQIPSFVLKAENNFSSDFSIVKSEEGEIGHQYFDHFPTIQRNLKIEPEDDVGSEDPLRENGSLNSPHSGEGPHKCGTEVKVGMELEDISDNDEFFEEVDRICYYCFKIGHIKPNCPYQLPENQTEEKKQERKEAERLFKSTHVDTFKRRKNKRNISHYNNSLRRQQHVEKYFQRRRDAGIID